MKLESQTISLSEKGPSLEISASPFLDLVHAFKDAIKDDESGASYRVIRAMAMSEADVLPKNRNEYPGNKLTKTQEWAAQLVRLAAKDVVLETEGESALPDQMGLGTRIESEASVLLGKLNFGYLGDPKVVFDPETGVKLDMTYAADYIRILRTYLPTKRELAITGGALALAAVMAACSSGTDRSTPTTIPDASPTSPRVTEVFTPTTAPTELTEVKKTEIISLIEKYVHNSYPNNGLPQNGVHRMYGIFYSETLSTPHPLLSTDGRELGKILVANTLYYLDAKGQLQFVEIPMVVELANGKVVWFGQSVSEPGARSVDEEANGLDRLDRAGVLVLIDAGGDLDKYEQGRLPRTLEDKRDYIEGFYAGRADQVQAFWQTGDPAISTLVPTIMRQVPLSEIPVN